MDLQFSPPLPPLLFFWEGLGGTCISAFDTLGHFGLIHGMGREVNINVVLASQEFERLIRCHVFLDPR